ncbi:MAG: sugar phosphate isomerase/epimerase [Phycisphaerae bacterium]|jgi:sugar phosphate isomerase/epimerase|nr:sugar phosphate isomerase/epimerase [Phycisphaerae bacterium]
MAGLEKVEIGVQTFTYRNFNLADTVAELQGTGITAAEVYGKHLGPKMSAGEIAECKRILDDGGIRVCAYGVEYFTGEGDTIRPTLEFVRDIGGAYASIDIEKDDIATQEKAVEIAEETGVLLAIHNHGPGANYSTIDDVLSVTEKNRFAMGACVDTGHFLRSDEDPVEAIRRIGKRVHAVHLKDFTGVETEVVPGTGKLDYSTMLAALREYTDFDGALVIEYEANAADPTPAMRETVALLKQALGE